MGSTPLINLAFWALAALTIVSAVFVAASTSLVHAVFALFFTFFGVAGLYVLLGADFLAIVQVILYIGGILVLMIFGVMLTNRVGTQPLKADFTRTGAAAVLSVLVFGLLATTLHSQLARVEDWQRTHGHFVRVVAAPRRATAPPPAPALEHPGRPEHPGASGAGTAAGPHEQVVEPQPPAVADVTIAEPPVRDTTATIGRRLVSDQLVPFEIASVLLLISMIGAASIARKEIE